MRYSENLLNYFHNTEHQGKLDVSLPNVFVADVGSTHNQELLQLFLQIENNTIVAARFLAMGSVAIIAGSEWLCEFVLQKSVDEVLALTAQEVLRLLCLSSVKIHVAQLLVAALKQCMDKK